MLKIFDIFKDEKLKKSLFSIAVPVMLQNLISYGITLMDTIMLGKLGEIELSAAALANQYATIYMVITFGIASGTNIMLAQYWGKGDVVSMRSIESITLRVSTVISLVFFLLAFFLPQTIMSIFTPDILIREAGVKYLKIVCFGYFMHGLTNVMLMTLRSIGNVKASMMVYGGTLVTNTFLNWVLIFGNLGAPALGIEGAAIATVISHTLEFIVTVYYVLFREKKIAFRLHDIVFYDKSFYRDYLHTAVPVIFAELIWSLGNSVLTVIMGQMGQGFVAANSIVSVVNQIATVATVGLGNAAAVIVGNLIGAGDEEKAKDFSRSIIFMSLMAGTAAGIIMFLLRPLIIGGFNVREDTAALTMKLLTVSSVVLAFQSVNFVEICGILRGGGDTRFALIIDTAFLWGFAIPLGFVAGLKFNLAPPIVYILLRSDEILKFFVGTSRIIKGKWVKNITR